MYIHRTAFAIALKACLASLFVCQAVSADDSNLRQYAENIVQAGGIVLPGNMYCEVGNGLGEYQDVYQGSTADALINVARQPQIYLLAHGFFPNPRRTKPSVDYVKTVWSGYLEPIRQSGKPYAACTFLSDTAKGFGVQQPIMGDFLFALRALTDDPELYNQNRRIYMVGYSAGVNYMKQAVVTYRDHLQLNGLPERGIALTKMKMIFLAGAHNGTDVSDLAADAVALLNVFTASLETEAENVNDRLQHRWNNYKRAERKALVSSAGARQLRSNSPALQRLNSRFIDSWQDDLVAINIFSIDDGVAGYETAHVESVKSIAMKGLGHKDFMINPLPNSLSLVLSRLGLF